MLEERDRLLSRQRLVSGFIARRSKGYDGFMWYFVRYTWHLSPPSMDARGKGNTKGTSSTFQSWNFFTAARVLACPGWIFMHHICIPVDGQKRIKDFFSLWNEALSPLRRTCRQFKNIFYFQSIWTHGFCKPLFCGCTYSYFVYWNKERSIYKIIKWSSPSSLHG